MPWRRSLQLLLAATAVASALSIQPRPAASQGSAADKASAAIGGAAPGGPGTPADEKDEKGEKDEREDKDDASDELVPRAVSPMPAGAAERRAWLTRELAAALAARPTLAGAKVGVAAQDLATGEALWQSRGDEPLSLASTAKLFTAAAALSRLGPGFQWRTAIYGAEAPNATAEQAVDDTIEILYLRGQGDPGLEATALRALATDLVDRGVRRIRKEIVLDPSYFDAEIEPPHFSEQPKERAAFRAPVSGLSLQRNAVTLVITPPPPGSDEPGVRLEPPTLDLFELERDELLVTEDGKTRLRVDFVKIGKGPKQRVRISGQLRRDAPPTYRRLRIDDPIAFAGYALRAALAAAGIRTPTKVSVGKVPKDARLLAFIDSAPLHEAVRRMNKTSDNFIAEVIYKTLGKAAKTAPAPTGDAQVAPVEAPGTWAEAAAVMRQFLTERGLPAVRVDNGSGLFDASAVSAAQLVALLAATARDFRTGPDLLASLPIGGVDGTLASRFHGRPAAGLVRAKTGTLAKVISLAGFVGVDSRQLIAFAILCNELTPAQRRDARALQEDLVDLLALYAGAPAAPRSADAAPR